MYRKVYFSQSFLTGNKSAMKIVLFMVMCLCVSSSQLPTLALAASQHTTFTQDTDKVANILSNPQMQTQAPSGRIVIRFSLASDLVMSQTGVISRNGTKNSDTGRIENLLKSVTNNVRLEKRFPSAEIKTNKQLIAAAQVPDLSRYAHFTTSSKDRNFLNNLLKVIKADPAIDLAFLEPVAVPAALGFDAFTNTYTPEALPQIPSQATNSKSSLNLRVTADFQDLQSYLNDAPLGVGALSMRSQAGATGAGITIVDVEGSWLWEHEDLPEPEVNLGTYFEDVSWRNHGTAVLGEIRGIENGLGVTGIVPQSSVGCSGIGSWSTAQALAEAVAVLDAGDLILIELHAPGPRSDGEGQFGYMPMEYWSDVFDVIQVATYKGILVIEAAGNGYQDLDDALYDGLFDRENRDSGAIMCGATNGSNLIAAAFSNHGQRVDLNGWGQSVTTCGYGTLQGEPAYPETEWYSDSFSGTSSASPIVTGSIASLVGMVRSEHGFNLDARLARDLLRQTGTAVEGSNLIGTRPDLVAAWSLAENGIGLVTGIVQDAVTLQPLANIQVESGDQRSFCVTGSDGSWSLPFEVGPVSFNFSAFGYEPTSTGVTVTSTGTAVANVSLQPYPRVNISGKVKSAYPGSRFDGLANAQVTIINQPVSNTVTDTDGNWTLNNVPANYTYRIAFGGVPGFGARVLDIETAGITADARINAYLEEITEDFEANNGGYNNADLLWEYGQPPVVITGGAFSGTKCWGVGMDGNGYNSEASGTLISPLYDFSGVVADKYYLSFHYLCATEANFDGVTLQMIGGPTANIIPLTGYTNGTDSVSGPGPGWSGYTNGWRSAVFEISEYLSSFTMFTITFSSDDAVNGDGFFIDGLTFGESYGVSPVPEPDLQGPGNSTLKAWPNPFNPTVNLEYKIPHSGQLDINVFDVRGRKVRTLFNAPVGTTKGQLIWNGKDNSGKTLSSGVYMIQVRHNNQVTATERVVLNK